MKQTLPPCPFGERKFCEIKLHETHYLIFFFLSPIVLGGLGVFLRQIGEKCSLLEAQKKFVCTI